MISLGLVRLSIARFNGKNLTVVYSASTPTDLGHRLSSTENVPHILSRGIITGAEAEALFKM